MYIMPRPQMPDPHIYQRPEREDVWNKYEERDARWLRDTKLTMLLNLSMALLGPISIICMVLCLWWLFQ